MNPERYPSETTISQLAELIDSLSSLPPDCHLSEEDANDLIAGALSMERLRELEESLANYPDLLEKLEQTRHEFASYYTPSAFAKTEARFRSERDALQRPEDA